MSNNVQEKLERSVIRGSIELYLDKIIKEESIEGIIFLFKKFKPIINNLEDAIIGYIIGEITSRYFTIYHVVLKREPTDEEVSELLDLLIRRSFQIRSKIKEVLMK